MIVEEEFEDIKIFDEYVNVINVDKNIYKKYVNKKLSLEEVSENKYFNNILNTFKESSEYKNKINQPSFKNQTEKEKKIYLINSFYKYSFDIEKQKMIYVALTYNQKTLIITSPTENDEQEKFLGYKWSNRKGKEGIQIIKEGGELYKDINNADDYDKIFASDLIKETFNDNFHLQSELLDGKYHYMRTVDLFDFSKLLYSNVINTSIIGDITIQRKYQIVKIKDYVNINEKTLDPKKYENKKFHYVDISSIDNKTKIINYDNILLGKDCPSRARRLGNNNDVLISTVRPNLKSFAIINEIPENTLFSTGFAILNTKNDKVLLNKFIYTMFDNDPILMKQMLRKMGKGEYPSINQEDINNFDIILPDLNVQKEIVDAFDYVDNELMKMQKNIDRIFISLDLKFNELFNLEEFIQNSKFTKYDLQEIKRNFDDGRGRVINKAYIESHKGKYTVYSSQTSNNGIFGFIDTYDFDGEYITWTTDGVNAGTVFYRNGKFNCTNVCGTLKRVLDSKINVFYASYILNKIAKKYVKHVGNDKLMNDVMKNIKIPVPPIKLQNEFAKFAEEKEYEKQKLIDEKDKLLIKKQELINKYFK